MNDRSIRVLHIVGGMNRCGVETWLMHVLRHINKARYAMDFLVHTSQECAYDRELVSLGSRLHYCPSPRYPIQYAMNFRRILRNHRPYDVVHSHVHRFGGYVLKLAHSAGIPVRIAHSHNATQDVDAKPQAPAGGIPAALQALDSQTCNRSPCRESARGRSPFWTSLVG